MKIRIQTVKQNLYVIKKFNPTRNRTTYITKDNDNRSKYYTYKRSLAKIFTEDQLNEGYKSYNTVYKYVQWLNDHYKKYVKEGRRSSIFSIELIIKKYEN